MITSNKKQRYQCANPNCKKAFSKPKLIKYYVCPTCQTLVIMDTKIFELNQEIKKENDSRAKENKSPRKKRKQKTELPDKKESEPSIVSQTDQPSETIEFKLSSNLPDLEAPIPEKSPIVFNSQSETEMNESEKTETNEDTIRNYNKPSVASENPSIDKLNESEKTETNEDTIRNYDKPSVTSENPSIDKLNESEKTETNEDIIRDYVKLSVASENPSIDKNSEAIGDEGKSISADSSCNRYFSFLSERGKGEEIPEDCFGCSKAIECMLGSNNSSNKKIEGIKQWYSSP